MKRWQRILCVLPFVFLVVSSLLTLVPLTLRVERVSDIEVRLTWSNVIYDYGIDKLITVLTWISSGSVFCLALLPEKHERTENESEKK